MLDTDQPVGNTAALASGVGPLLLDELSIPGATGPVPSGEWGVNLAAARENFPRKGLQLYVPAWPQMSRGDRVRAMAGSDEVDSVTITEGLENQRQTLFVPPGHLQTGDAELSYRVKRLGQVEELSAVTRIYVKLERPGGQDQDGSNPGHSELKFTLPDDVVNDGVDKERAARGVEVTILPYPFMAEHDRIRLSWGGVFVEHTVKLEEMGNPIVILVEETVILEAGDSDDKGLAVTYEVYDLVDNRSEDWSAEQRVIVDTGNARLSAPILKEAKSNVLDLEVLGDANATLQVVAFTEPFAVNDRIVATLFGETEDGRLVNISYPPKLVESVPAVIDIPIANADVRQLAKTLAKFSYELVKSEAARQGMGAQAYQQQRAEGAYKSRGQFVSIVGEAVRLPAPKALDAQQGTLDPALPETTIEVLWDDSMQAGDVVTLVWEGEKPDFTPYFPEIPPHDISNGEAERKEPISFTVDGKHLKAIEGGKLVLHYALERDGQSPRRSERTITFSVGKPRAELAKPNVNHAEQQADGSWVLDPEKVPVGGTKLVVERYARIAIGDVLYFSWKGDEAGSLEDSIRITATNIGREQFELTISKALVIANDGHKVVASYWVERAEGGGTSYSEPLTLQVGAVVPVLPELVIEEATEKRVIDPALVAEGATVFIDASAALQPQDKVRIEVTGAQSDDKTHTVTQAGEQRFKIAAEVITGNEDSQIIVTYFVSRGGTGPEQPSAPVEFTVLPVLPELVIDEATAERVIDPEKVKDGATVIIAASAELQPQDKVRINVTGAHPDTQTHTVTQAGEQRFKIDAEVIMGNEDSQITVTYFVSRGGTGPEQPSAPVEFTVLPVLPELVIDEATEEKIIDPWIVLEGATVFIAASAELQPQDKVRIEVTGSHPDTQTHTVTQAGEQRFKIAYSVIKANENGSIGVTYVVLPGGNPPERRSGTVEYEVRAGRLQVFGARHARNAYLASSASRYLLAYWDGKPVMAEWRYSGALQWSNAREWLDSQPHLPLQVRAGDDLLTLNPVNIFGNGSNPTSGGAFVALRNDGRVRGWGSSFHGGAIPREISELDDVVEVSSAESAYAVRRVDGSVMVWGYDKHGGSLGGVSSEGFREVVGTRDAFAGLKETGSVVAWGREEVGGSVPAPIAKHTDIVRVFAADMAFAALRTTKQVVAWGATDFGGTIPGPIQDLRDIEEVLGNTGAFAARRANGTLVAWGSQSYGGNAAPVAGYTDIVRLCGANIKAFLAQRATGHLVAWGDPDYGGKLPPEIGGYSDIIDVVATVSAFAAMRRNGSVVAWGSAYYGGVLPAEIKDLTNVVQVARTDGAFAVLSHDGTVKAWGDKEMGGDTSPVASKLVGIQALYGNTKSFVALRRDGRVISWGHKTAGGDNSAVRDQLDGYVTYRAQTQAVAVR